MDKDLIIETGGWILCFAGLYAISRAAVWYMKNGLSRHTLEAVRSFVMRDLAVALNTGWFAVSRMTSGDDTWWNPVMYEWRWLLVSVTAALYLSGVVYFVESMEDGGILTMIVSGLSIIGVGLIFGVFL